MTVRFITVGKCSASHFVSGGKHDIGSSTTFAGTMLAETRQSRAGHYRPAQSSLRYYSQILEMDVTLAEISPHPPPRGANHSRLLYI